MDQKTVNRQVRRKKGIEQKKLNKNRRLKKKQFTGKLTSIVWS